MTFTADEKRVQREEAPFGLPAVRKIGFRLHAARQHANLCSFVKPFSLVP
jgi:hypothetical protein